MIFSLVIPTYNRPDLLKFCLNGISPLVQNFSTLEYEVIVSDDSDNDYTRLMMATIFPQLTWLEGPKIGPAANRNRGAGHASGDWIIFLDDDVIPDKNLLRKYAFAIRKFPNHEAFEGAILPDDWDLLKKDMSECPVNIYGNCFWTANVCIKKSLFFTLGGFDEKFTIAAQEDQDFFEKIKKNTEVIFIRDAFVVHPVRIVKLTEKLRNANISIQNWFKYTEKKYGFLESLCIGYRSNIYAAYSNLRNRKIKNFIYNSYTILILFPSLLILKIKNAK